MKNSKKVLSLMMILALCGTSLAGCGSKSEETSTTGSDVSTTDDADDTSSSAEATEAPTDGADSTDTTTSYEAADLADIIPEEEVELTVYSQLANYSGEQIGWFAQVMKDKFNVKLNIVNSPEGVFNTRLESGELGDIVVFGSDGDEYKQAIAAGLLWDWEDEDLVENYGPYIYANMQNALEKNRTVSGDGHIYGFGHNVGSSTDAYELGMYHPDIRWDLYADLGYPEVSTLEDYVDILADMVAANPTSDSGQQTYAVSLFKDWDGDSVMYVKSLAALYGYDEFGMTLYNCNTQTAEPILDDDGMYIRALKFYNALYQKGLVDPDSMTQTYDEACDVYRDGGAFFNIFNFLGQSLYNSSEHTSEGKGMYPLTATDMCPLVYGLNIYGGNRIWSVGANTEYPELCMAIINWFSTPEGVMTYSYGPQGTTWDYDENGDPYLTDLGLEIQKSSKTEMTGDYSGTFDDGSFKITNTTWSIDSVNPDGNDNTFNCKSWESYLNQPVTVAEQAWRDYTGFLTPEEYISGTAKLTVAIGSTYSTGTKDDDLTTVWNQVKEAVKTYSWQAIYASSDEEFSSIIKEMQEKCDEYGYQQCVDWCMNEASLRKAAEDEAKAAE